MSYLERNEALIAELQAQGDKLERGEVVGQSTFRTFTPAGSFQSEVLEREVCVGVKEHRDRDGLFFVSTEVARGLAVITIITEEIPQLAPKFPLFYGLVVDAAERAAIITEDFSRTGRLEITNYDNLNSGIPKVPELSDLEKVPDLFGTESMSREDLFHMIFTVDGQTRLGDIPFVGSLSGEKDARVAGVGKEIRQALSQHTVRLDRNFF